MTANERITSSGAEPVEQARQEITYREAIVAALREEMRRDPKTLIMGEDIGESGGPFFGYRVAAEGRVIAYSADTEWTDMLVALARDVDLFIAEAYTYDEVVKNHLSLKTLEAHLPKINPKRLILTHMSDDMLARLGTLGHTAASDGMIVEL